MTTYPVEREFANRYAEFVRRILRGYARRVGDAHIEALALMLGLTEEIDTA